MQAARLGTFGDEWQCDRRGRRARGTSGSAGGTIGAHEGRVAVRLTLPLGIERTESARPRGEWQCAWNARVRVAVQFTLPLGGERTGRHVQGRVAVRLTLPLGGERTGQRTVHCHSSVNVRIGTFRAEWQCWPGRTPDPQPSCRLESGPTGQMRSGNRLPSRRGGRAEACGPRLGA